MSIMPVQKPGRSKQDYGTPLDFIQAVQNEFGLMDFDLAATHDNKIASSCFTLDDDSLSQDWTKLSGNLWLNPPFSNIGLWAKKCSESIGPGRQIFLLTPASIGSNWYANYVINNARVYGLLPRLTFVGCKDPYPKDLMLSLFRTKDSGHEVWNWRK